MTTMEGASGSSFGIDTILSSASSGSPGMMNGDFRPLGEARTADFRSQATPSPCSEIDTVGTAPSSPISVTMEPPEPHLIADGPQHHHHLHHSQQPPPAAAPTQSLQPSPQQQPPPPPPAAQQLGSAASAPRTWPLRCWRAMGRPSQSRHHLQLLPVPSSTYPPTRPFA